MRLCIIMHRNTWRFGRCHIWKIRRCPHSLDQLLSWVKMLHKKFCKLRTLSKIEIMTMLSTATRHKLVLLHHSPRQICKSTSAQHRRGQEETEQAGSESCLCPGLASTEEVAHRSMLARLVSIRRNSSRSRQHTVERPRPQEGAA